MMNERALSEAVSTILIIFLVVALTIIVVIFVFGINIFQEKSAFLAPDIRDQVVGGKEVISLFHRGGDTAYLNLSLPRKYQMSVNVDTTSGAFRALPLAGVDAFSPGTTFYVFYNRTTGGFNVTDSISSLAVAAPVLPAGVTGVHLVDENAHLLIVQWGTPAISPADLSVVSVSPGSGFNTTPAPALSLVINGTGFLPGATVRLNRTTFPDIPATGITVVNSTRITCSVNLNNVPAGPRNVVVTLPGGSSATLVNVFTVNQKIESGPTITSISNPTGNRGWPVEVTIDGTNFVTGASVKLNRTGYPDIPVSGVAVVTPTRITCTLNLLGVQPGSWNVAVTNPDGRGALQTGYFTVLSPAPGISDTPAFFPDTGTLGTMSLSITAPGTGFQPGMAVVLISGSTTLTGYNVNVISPTQVTFQINIPATATNGHYRAQFTNTDGQSVTHGNRFTV